MDVVDDVDGVDGVDKVDRMSGPVRNFHVSFVATCPAPDLSAAGVNENPFLVARPMTADLWAFEKEVQAKGYARIAGVDEAGRGPLAGPVVSAAVVLPRGFDPTGINDSKQLSAAQRERMYARIYADADAVGIGIVDPCEIDRINILRAALLSMAIAVANIRPRPGYLLIDGTFAIPADYPQRPVTKGDSRSVSIAAASIVAKVTRDRIMRRYHEDYPQFGFDCHKGYATAAHLEALACHGPCAIHRRSFKGVCTCSSDQPEEAFGISVDE